MLIGNNNNEAGLFNTTSAMQGQRSNETTNLYTNLGYTCGASVAAQRRVDKGIHVWRYRWMGEWPNQRISPYAGAFHGSEIAHVFGLAEQISKKTAATEQQLKIATVMNKAWATFAKDPVNGLLQLGWPLYNASGKSCGPIIPAS
jgi:carboxylesterase type B